ncbi:MAG: hypothetical protein JSV44_08365 [Candidatus Zixiibacteriota bacterium]|nr:MAG: hypothetical protein JSV44_08365 [candidate division Zixibacteria bacterium]
MLTLYKIFTLLVYYLSLPVTFWTRLSGSRKWHNRMGFFDHVGLDRDENCGANLIWLHASSMGEVQVLVILADHLRRHDTSIELFATVMTDTGYARACEAFGDCNQVGFLPLDYRTPIRRFLDAVNPRAAVFIETEIWPNMVVELGRRNIPVFLANGRLSRKSHRNYRLFKSGLKEIFLRYNRIMVQSKSDRERYIGIGAPAARIEVLGSLKFDAPMVRMTPEKKCGLRNSLPFSEGKRIMIAGSIRNGEYDIMLDVYKGLVEQHDQVRLILVPRHLDRIGDIRKLAVERGLTCRLYSELSCPENDVQVLIVDRMGILNDLYSVSDIAFVGGTLIDIGGHNILEPVWCGIPVLYGPSIGNVRDSSDYIQDHHYGAMMQNRDELYQSLHGFFAGEATFRRKGDNDINSGAAPATARIIMDSLKSDGKALAENNRK